MVKIHQLFRVKVTYELLQKIYACFGYTSLTPEYTFCKTDLERLKTVENMHIIKDELCQYYIPCKAKLYLNNLDITKCVTIFRQVLKLYNIILISKQKYIKQKKLTFYSIKFETDEGDQDSHSMRVNNNHLVVSFS